MQSILPDYTERLAGWQLKALREAKLATDWTAPDLEYEDAARSFLYTIMADGGFIAEARAFAQRIGPAGAVNGLAQTLLKLTVPGVPDFYQGAEFWDQSMVDPDNRRPVDFARRIAALAAARATGRTGGALARWPGEAGGDPRARWTCAGRDRSCSRVGRIGHWR